MIVITDKNTLVNNVKTEVNRLLSKDDWMSIREFEGGEAMPDNVKAYRASIRDESNTKVAYINNCLDDDCLIAYQNKSFTKIRNGESSIESIDMSIIFLTKDPRIDEHTNFTLDEVTEE